MNKTLYILSLIVVLTLTSCQSSLMTDQTTAHNLPLEINTDLIAKQPPVEITVPETLPTTIEDPIFLEGWVRLYNRTQNCMTWDGSTLTGQKLAQYVIDQAVVITWNTSPIYIGSWVDRDNTGTIYIDPGFKEETETRMVYLVGEIAHEIFHDLAPFNQKADTLYEEYWAFYVGACVSGQSTEDFEHYNPMSSDSLTQWFKDNRRGNYLGVFDTYPEDMVAISLP